MVLGKVVYSLITALGDMAGDMVSPAKTPAQVMEESAVGSDLYKKSHLRYDVG